MRVLLDTHALLWFSTDDANLGDKAAEVISDPATERLLSIASVWEMAIKTSLGKLTFSTSLDTFLDDAKKNVPFNLLPIALEHALGVASLEFHHRDPFDRLIAVQAIEEDLLLVSCDSGFDEYGVDRIW